MWTGIRRFRHSHQSGAPAHPLPAPSLEPAPGGAPSHPAPACRWHRSRGSDLIRHSPAGVWPPRPHPR